MLLISHSLLDRGRQPVALVGGAGAAPAGSASSAGPPGASGVTARPNYVGPSARAGGADERRAKVPAGSRRPRERLLPFPEGGLEDEGKRRSGAPGGAPARVMGRQSRPLTGWVSPQGRPTVAAFRGCEFRRSATLTWRGEGFETDNLARQPAGMRRAATLPHGSTMYGEG